MFPPAAPPPSPQPYPLEIPSAPPAVVPPAPPPPCPWSLQAPPLPPYPFPACPAPPPPPAQLELQPPVSRPAVWKSVIPTDLRQQIEEKGDEGFHADDTKGKHTIRKHKDGITATKAVDI